jgi:hypothetical protein
MAHDHGIEFQVKVIHEDGTEALSEWIEQENVAQTVAALRKPQARAYWLRERNVTVAACPLCQESETAMVEYPLADCLSSRSRPHDSSYLVSTGSRDPYMLCHWSAVNPPGAEPPLPPITKGARLTRRPPTR